MLRPLLLSGPCSTGLPPAEGFARSRLEPASVGSGPRRSPFRRFRLSERSTRMRLAMVLAGCAALALTAPALAAESPAGKVCTAGTPRPFDYAAWEAGQRPSAACCDSGNKAFFSTAACCAVSETAAPAVDHKAMVPFKTECGYCENPQAGNRSFFKAQGCSMCAAGVKSCCAGLSVEQVRAMQTIAKPKQAAPAVGNRSFFTARGG